MGTGAVSVVRVYLPIISWQRRETVRFETRDSPLSGVLLESAPPGPL